MNVVVVKPGAMTTVQDAGRPGHRHLGVGAGGALDRFSARIANLLVGNDDDAAVLEITLAGPTLEFATGVRLALCGADIDAQVGDVWIGGWRRVDLPAASRLRLGGCRLGARAYLAVAGGFNVAPIMGSRATDVRGGFGGLDGRALRAGDRLACDARDVDALAVARTWLDPRPDLDLAQTTLAHVMPGADVLAAADVGRLYLTQWRVAPASDRQGLRLQGPVLAPHDARERVSAPVAPGTVQLPPDGQPIVLLAEAQTVGGYPVIGHVATADLPRLAQCRPGDALRLAPIDRDGALARLRAQSARIERMRLAVAKASATI